MMMMIKIVQHLTKNSIKHELIKRLRAYCWSKI